VIADAQQGKLYVQSFAAAAGRWRPVGGLAVRRGDEWRAARDPAAWLAGPGVRAAALVPADARVVPPEFVEPRPDAVLALAKERLAAGGDDVWAVEPLYLRPSSAEENWAKRGGTG
jgi:tRNA threonylcarbamoyladenosine biosynthesis protein TsaB